MRWSDLFGSELPIVQAPMAGAQASALTLAVCGAGGIGSLPAALLSSESLDAELRGIRDGTDRPFNVNFFCHAEPPVDPERDRWWRTVLEPYFAELGADLPPTGATVGRASFSPEIADIVEQFAPPIVSFHFGLPAEHLLQRVRSWGSRIVASATTIDEARWLEARGVDAIIAQGSEAGGHRGMFLSDDVAAQVGTFALLPQIVQSVRVPVIAAGGIADAGSVSAALKLGAAGVQVGTAYLLCPEATTSPLHRVVLASESARATAVTNVFTGRPARAIVNRLMRELGYVVDGLPAFPLPTPLSVALRTAAEARGISDFSPFWCGQNATGCRAVPAATLTHDLASGL